MAEIPAEKPSVWGIAALVTPDMAATPEGTEAVLTAMVIIPAMRTDREEENNEADFD